MFEYNCDTPTAMLETAVVQWEWMEAVFPKADQFNSLHDKLLAKWQDIGPYLKSRSIHFTHMNDHAEKRNTITVSYLRDLAEQAGINSTAIFMKDIGWNATTKRFVDLDGQPIDVLFHLYPWEWLVNEEFGPRIVDSCDAMDWIEPVWKMMLSNKAILPVLWELFPGHPNLLPCYTEPRGSRIREEARCLSCRRRQHHDREGRQNARRNRRRLRPRRLRLPENSSICRITTATARCWAAGLSTATPPAWASARTA